MKKRLWWYAALLVIFLVVAWGTGSTNLGFDAVLIFAGALIALAILLAVIDGFLELRERRNGDH